MHNGARRAPHRASRARRLLYDSEGDGGDDARPRAARPAQCVAHRLPLLSSVHRRAERPPLEEPPRQREHPPDSHVGLAGRDGLGGALPLAQAVHQPRALELRRRLEQHAVREPAVEAPLGE